MSRTAGAVCSNEWFGLNVPAVKGLTWAKELMPLAPLALGCTLT
jgi:hypothetical protein